MNSDLAKQPLEFNSERDDSVPSFSQTASQSTAENMMRPLKKDTVLNNELLQTRNRLPVFGDKNKVVYTESHIDLPLMLGFGEAMYNGSGPKETPTVITPYFCSKRHKKMIDLKTVFKVGLKTKSEVSLDLVKWGPARKAVFLLANDEMQITSSRILSLYA